MAPPIKFNTTCEGRLKVANRTHGTSHATSLMQSVSSVEKENLSLNFKKLNRTESAPSQPALLTKQEPGISHGTDHGVSHYAIPTQVNSYFHVDRAFFRHDSYPDGT